MMRFDLIVFFVIFMIMIIIMIDCDDWLLIVAIFSVCHPSLKVKVVKVALLYDDYDYIFFIRINIYKTDS